MKYNTSFKLTFITLFFSVWLSAQGWERRLPNWTQATATDVTLNPEGGLIVTGSISGSVQGRVVQLNADGDLQWFVPLSGIGLQRVLSLGPDRYAGFGARPVSGQARFNYVEFGGHGQQQGEQLTIFEEFTSMQIVKVIPVNDAHYMVFGYAYSGDSARGQDFFTAQFDRQGQLNWIRPLDVSTKDWSFDIVPTSDGNYVMCGLVETNGFDRPFVMKLDPQGQEIWRNYDVGIGFSIRNIVEDQDGTLIAVSFHQPPNTPPQLMLTHLAPYTGAVIQRYQINDLDIVPQTTLLDQDGQLIMAGNQITDNSPLTYRVTLLKISTTGDPIWQKTYGQVNESQRVEQLIALPGAGYVMVGDVRAGSGLSQSYIIKTDGQGNSLTNVINGRIYQADCAGGVQQRSLQDWYVQISSERDTFYGLTDQQGYYEVQVDTGAYRVSVLQPNIYWAACSPEENVYLATPFEAVSVDFPMDTSYSCPLLRVDVSTPFLRRCYENKYYVNYCNEGTEAADNALLEVELDPAFLVESSEPAWTEREGQLLRFELGRLEIGACGQVTISGRLDCDNTVLGQSHCVTAQIYPDSLCTPPGVNWDGSSIELNGQCIGDSIQFNIRNVGDGDMLHELRYIVIEDLIIHRSGYFQLSPDEELQVTVPATGATYRMEAEQAEGHPGSSHPSVTVEGCRLDGQAFQTGFVTQNPFDEGDPFIAIDCQENIGSWDPNDIRIFPKGQGPEHLVDADTELEYHIRFQNTGTDTAFRVLIRDTLPLDALDLGSLEMGAASHPFEWWINNSGVLHFLFDPIALPDSTSNEADSHGFVRFKIRQNKGIVPGTIINNRAAIYFDYNEPVLTNTAWVQVKKPVAYYLTNQVVCTMDIMELEEYTVVDTVSLAMLDSLYISNVTLLPQQEVIIDTSIQAGHVYLDMEWLESGQVRDSLQNQWGCDSLVIFNVQVDRTNRAEEISPEERLQLSIYPNPVSDFLNIRYLLRDYEKVEISILDASGRELLIINDQKLNAAGMHHIRWPAQQLPPGLYMLRLRAGMHLLTGKFLLLK